MKLKVILLMPLLDREFNLLPAVPNKSLQQLFRGRLAVYGYI